MPLQTKLVLTRLDGGSPPDVRIFERAGGTRALKNPNWFTTTGCFDSARSALRGGDLAAVARFKLLGRGIEGGSSGVGVGRTLKDVGFL